MVRGGITRDAFTPKGRGHGGFLPLAVRRTPLVAFCDKQTSGCEDHKCAHMYRRVGGMMLDVHVAILSKPLHICEPVVFPSFLASQNGGGGRKQVVSSSMGA